jgi:hypothetical protein
MAGQGMREAFRDITLYLIILIAVSTLGPLQFGLHLVRPPACLHCLGLTRQSS